MCAAVNTVDPSAEALNALNAEGSLRLPMSNASLQPDRGDWEFLLHSSGSIHMRATLRALVPSNALTTTESGSARHE